MDEIKEIIRDLGKGQREIQESQKKTEESQRKTTGESQRKTEKSIQKTQESINKSDGNFNNKWGAFMESLISGDLVKLLNERKISVVKTSPRMRSWPLEMNSQKIKI